MRQPNQYRMLKSASELTEGAERLLLLISKYQYSYNVTNQQYAYLMGISLRNTVKYIGELIDKGKIEVFPKNRKSRGRSRANKYVVIGEFDSDQECE